MKRILIACAALLFSWSAHAQTTERFGVYVGGLPAASSIGGADSLYVLQGGVSKKSIPSLITPQISIFTSTLSGAVPGSGGGTANFLRADGSWSPPPNTGVPGGSTLQVQFNNGGVFGGYTNAQLTALINNFTSGLSGSVPGSGGGTANFLRADGTWSVPPGAGGSAGGANGSVQYNNSGSLGGFGNFNGTNLLKVAVDAVSPVSFTVAGQSVSTGTLDTNGGALFINGGAATGAGVGGAVNIGATSSGLASGTTQNANVIRLTVQGNANGANVVVGSGVATKPDQLLIKDFAASGTNYPQLEINANNTLAYYGFGQADTGTTSGRFWFGPTLANGLGWDTNNAHLTHFEIFNGSFGLGNGGTVDVYLARVAANTLALGGTTGVLDVASPAAMTLQVQNVATGTTNTAGADFSIIGSRGTGNASGGNIKIFTSNPAGGGSSQNGILEAIRIDGLQQVTVGSPSQANVNVQTVQSNFQILDNTNGNWTQTLVSKNNNGAAASLGFYKTRSATYTGLTAVQNGDLLSDIEFMGNDSVFTITAAAIKSAVDGAVSVGTIPGRLLLYTATNGSPIEAVRIDSAQRVVLGGSAAISSFDNGSTSPHLQMLANATTSFNAASLGLARFTATATGDKLYFAKSRGTTIGDYTIVQNADELGVIHFQGSDGTTFQQAATIQGFVDNTPGAAAMPGRLVFSTTPSGGSAAVEAMRIDRRGRTMMAGIGAHVFVDQFQDEAMVETLAPNGTQFVNIAHFAPGNNGNTPVEMFLKTRGANVNTQVAVQNNDGLGCLYGAGSDGTNFSPNAFMCVSVDGTVASNSVPSRIDFFTSNGSGNYNEGNRVRINHNGVVTMGEGSSSFLTAQSKFDTSAVTPALQLIGASIGGASIGVARYTANANPPRLYLTKSRSNSSVGYTIVQQGDFLGDISFEGADGTQFVDGAKIRGYVENVPGANNIPGAILMATSSSAIEAVRYDSDQHEVFNYGVGDIGGSFTPVTSAQALTSISNASPAVFTAPSPHGLVTGEPILLTTTGTLPTGLSTLTTYYVISAGLTTTQFEVSTTYNGSAVNTSSAGSGVHTFTPGQTATISIASPAVITAGNHGLVPGETVTFATTGTLPTGITAGTTYYVIPAGFTLSTFEISTSPPSGGANPQTAVNTSGTQSGTQTVFPGNAVVLASSMIIPGHSGLTNGDSAPALKIQQTWNTTSTIDAALLVNVTNIASGTSSRLFDIQQNGASVLVLDKSAFMTWTAPTSGSNIVFEDFGNAGIGMFTFNTGGGSFMSLNTARGTASSPAAVVVGDELAAWQGRGARNSAPAYATAGLIEVFVDSGTVSGTSMPGRLAFSTTTDGTVSPVEAMRIDNAQRVAIGGHASITGQLLSGGVNGEFQILGTSGEAAAGIIRYSNGATSGRLHLAKSRGAAIGTNTIVSSGDAVGQISFEGADGTLFDQAAVISGEIDGTPGASNNMPGRLVFLTTPASSATPSEHIRLDSKGHVNFTTTAPTASACTGFALSTGSSDTAGRVTFTSATSCAISFGGGTFTNAPFCMVMPGSAASTVQVTTSTTVLTATFGTAQTAMQYHCFGS